MPKNPNILTVTILIWNNRVPLKNNLFYVFFYIFGTILGSISFITLILVVQINQ